MYLLLVHLDVSRPAPTSCHVTTLPQPRCRRLETRLERLEPPPHHPHTSTCRNHRVAMSLRHPNHSHNLAMSPPYPSLDVGGSRRVSSLSSLHHTTHTPRRVATIGLPRHHVTPTTTKEVRDASRTSTKPPAPLTQPRRVATGTIGLPSHHVTPSYNERARSHTTTTCRNRNQRFATSTCRNGGSRGGRGGRGLETGASRALTGVFFFF